MTDEEYIPSINKLFNSLGRKMTKRYYGLDVTFEVISITPISFDDVYLVNADYNYGELKSLRVKVTPPIPQIEISKIQTPEENQHNYLIWIAFGVIIIIIIKIFKKRKSQQN